MQEKCVVGVYIYADFSLDEKNPHKYKVRKKHKKKQIKTKNKRFLTPTSSCTDKNASK